METEKQDMITLFREIAAGQSVDTARQFLEATNWNLEEAIQLFFIRNEGGGLASSSYSPPANAPTLPDQTSSGLGEGIVTENVVQKDGNEEMRAPLPVKRDILYDDALLFRASTIGYPSNDPTSMVAFRNFNEEMKHPGVWEAEQSAASSADTSRDNLASLYRPPFALMQQGPFEKAKQVASEKDKWLLVNVQSTKEFSSHMLNRDTWANEAVAQTISTNFIFWQVNDDTTEGRKVCTYYKLESIPEVLVIDPITGQKIRSWSGMIDPESLLEDLLPFMDSGPKNHHVTLPHKRPRETSQTSVHKVQGLSLVQGNSLVQTSNTDETTEEDEDVLLALAASMEDIKDLKSTSVTDKSESGTEEFETGSGKMPVYPPLPEEPKVDKSLLCRVGVRFPDGRRLQRNFLRTDPVQLLWSFCKANLEDADGRLFRVTQAIPGATNTLDYEKNLTFGESGLANSMVSVTWE